MRLWISIILTGLVLSCAASTRKSASCPPPGTEEPLAKVMNASFAKGFEGCDIAIDAAFMATGTGGGVPVGCDTDTHTMFMVTAADGTGAATNPLTGAAFGTLASLPKSKSDILFQLKQGDKIQLRGGTWFLEQRGNFVYAVFEATSLTRSPGGE